jgi:hypothetical protein
MAKPLGEKSRLIRDAINNNPGRGNTELAQRVNDSDAAKKAKIEVKASDVAQQKQAMKKAGGKAAPAVAGAETAATSKPTGNGRRKGAGKRQGGAGPKAAALSPGKVADDVAAIKLLVQKLGADQVRQIVDLFE